MYLNPALRVGEKGQRKWQRKVVVYKGNGRSDEWVSGMVDLLKNVVECRKSFADL